MLNASLDTSKLANAFAVDRRVRVTDVLDAQHAERMRNACAQAVRYDYLFTLDGKNYALSADDMRQLGRERFEEMQASVAAAASNGVGFFYCGYKMGREDKQTRNAELRFLHSVFDFLNGDDMLRLVRSISGVDDIVSADAQYTRYTPGQFLTRHRDDEGENTRRLAYVLSLSKSWHPDWGGLLQFFTDDGAPIEAWTPRFNTLALFDVRHPHSVTYVTPFAKEPRFSLTGWFLGPPP